MKIEINKNHLETVIRLLGYELNKKERLLSTYTDSGDSGLARQDYDNLNNIINGLKGQSNE